MQDLTVTKYLEDDHRRLDAIAQEVGRRLGVRAFSDAARSFGEFAVGLNRHIDAEEQVLFPTFERLTGGPGGPTIVMRSEHVDIRQLMKDVSGALRDENASLASQKLGELVELLGAHNRKEEGMLYPVADGALGTPAARAALVREMQAI